MAKSEEGRVKAKAKSTVLGEIESRGSGYETEGKSCQTELWVAFKAPDYVIHELFLD